MARAKVYQKRLRGYNLIIKFKHSNTIYVLMKNKNLNELNTSVFGERAIFNDLKSLNNFAKNINSNVEFHKGLPVYKTSTGVLDNYKY